MLILEDDYLQAEWIQQVITDNFKGSKTVRISTEHDFDLGRVNAFQPDLILIDVMMRWTDPDSDAEMPQEIADEGFYRAGLRCERLLRTYGDTEKIPVILYTVLEKADFEVDLENLHPKTRYIEKNSDPTDLIEMIKNLLGIVS
jgi:CheY-like chemotaxis protein